MTHFNCSATCSQSRIKTALSILKCITRRGEKKGEKQRQHRIALLLQMDRLGWVRADLGVVDGRLHINFFVQDEATRSQFTRQADAVRQSLGVFFRTRSNQRSVSREDDRPVFMAKT